MMRMSAVSSKLILCASAFVLAACVTTQPPAPTTPRGGPVVERPPVVEPVQPTPTDGAGEERPDEVIRDVERPTEVVPYQPQTKDGIAPAHLAGKPLNRLALLLPFTAGNPRLQEEAASMLQAAELALFDRDSDDTVLIVLDSQGTSAGAGQAAEAAIAAGADVILGPVLAGEVRAVSRVAARRDVPVVAFSTDTNVAGRGTYLLSFPPEAEVARIVEYAAGLGTTNFAILGPSNEYGRRVGEAYRNEVRNVGAQVTAAGSYTGNDISAMQEPAKRMADFYRRGEAASGATGKQPFEAVLLPEGGTALRSLAPLLPFYNSSMNTVQFLGTALWMREDTAREPALSGGLFAGPDQGTREVFETAYERAYGAEPSRLASLAHDAVDVGAVIAAGDPRTRRIRAEDPQGFYGADGFVSFNTDGTPARGLAVYEIVGGRFRVVDPAPRGAPGIN